MSGTPLCYLSPLTIPWPAHSWCWQRKSQQSISHPSWETEERLMHVRHLLDVKRQHKSRTSTHWIFPEAPSQSLTVLAETNCSSSMDLLNHFQNPPALLEWLSHTLTASGCYLLETEGQGSFCPYARPYEHETVAPRLLRKRLPCEPNQRSGDEEGIAVDCCPTECACTQEVELL